jgi:hypothetical protein
MGKLYAAILISVVLLSGVFPASANAENKYHVFTV